MRTGCKMHEIIQASRGFQHLHTYHFNHHIKCVAQQASDAVGVFYNIGSDNVACVCPYKQNEPQTKCNTDDNISALIYIKKYRLYVASCPDLALRIYGEHFELIDTVHVTATVLSLVFNESTSELFTGSVGCIDTWKLRHQYHNPLIPSTPLKCSIQKQQWIVALELDLVSEKLVATCRDTVYIIDTHTYEQINSFTNTHHGSLTSSVLIDHLGYLLTAAKDGTIKVWNTLLHNEIHTFSGHVKAVTGLKANPSVPCVISCSVDGSVRIWHLENMTECYRMDCGEELLGMCSDIPLGNKLACYSHSSLRLWTVNQLEIPFASINSHVVHMTRVEGAITAEPRHPARILALAEDGGVRLISPLSGQVITILLPMSSAQLLQDVVYSLVDNLLFVLLKTNDVLLCTAHVNPCSALELWCPNQTQTKIHCIAKVVCNVEVGDDEFKECTLVFGGQEDGNIGLLFSSKCFLSMPLPCPAHDGHVIKLIGSCNPILLSTNQESSSSTLVSTALVSYGSDNMLNVWVLSLERETTIVLRLQMSVLMDLALPVHFKLFDSIVCVTLVDHSLSMFPVRASLKTDNKFVATSCNFSSLQQLKHQLEDEHTDVILSLDTNTILGLLVTTSCDGFIKIWNKENQLISEMFFGQELLSACFLNPKGDLLVGFQKNIRVVQADDYLPANYLDIGRSYPHFDTNETQMPFDPDLQFWYDSERIPSLPPQQEARRQHLKAHLSLRTVLHRTITNFTTKDSENAMSGYSLESSSSLDRSSLQSKVDGVLAQELSRQYFMELCEQKPCAKIRRLIPYQVHISPNCSEEICSTTNENGHPSASNMVLSSLTGSSHTTAGVGNRSGQTSLSSLQLRESSSSIPTQTSEPKAMVLPLESPSTKSIAPDVYLVKCSQLPEFNKACHAIAELASTDILDGTHLKAVSNTIATRLQATLKMTPSSSVYTFRAAALNSLEKLGVATRAAVLAVLPFLTNTNNEVRAAAFRALRQLTGVVNRDQLRQLLVEMDLLRHVDNNEDEVLRELEQRIRNGVVNIRSSNTLLTNIRIGTKPCSVTCNSSHKYTLQNGHQSNTTMNKHLNTAHPTRIRKHHHGKPERHQPTPLDNRYQSATITRRLTQFDSKESGISITNYDPLRVSSSQRETSAPSRLRDNCERRKPEPKHLNKLHQFIARHPNVLSQMKPTIQMMMKAYGVKIPPRHPHTSATTDDVDRLLLSETYVWNEVFPVVNTISLRPETTCGQQHRITTHNLITHTFRAHQTINTQEHYQSSRQSLYEAKRALKLQSNMSPPSLQRCYNTPPTTATGGHAQVMVRVKLPEITSSRLTLT